MSTTIISNSFKGCQSKECEMKQAVKATLVFTSREKAMEFAKAWTRKTMEGHTVSASEADGTTQVDILNITPDRKTWVDEFVDMSNATHRTASEVQADLVQARRAFDHYNNIQFEGHGNPDNYYLNPHHKAIDALSAELYAIKQNEVAAKLVGESLKIEQAWFNAQQFRFPDIAQKACQARGYDVGDLFAAVKAVKQA